MAVLEVVTVSVVDDDTAGVVAAVSVDAVVDVPF